MQGYRNHRRPPQPQSLEVQELRRQTSPARQKLQGMWHLNIQECLGCYRRGTDIWTNASNGPFGSSDLAICG
ncbi:unnamed protein product [Fusarium graminearum]|nr:unnamed protein product [Fusarium graminearum]